MSFLRPYRPRPFASAAALLLFASDIASAASLAAAKLERIEQLITAEMSRQNIPGMSVAIASGDSTWSNGYGMSDLENFVPAKASTVYRLASISKPMTAVAVMQLVEQHKIDLDAPVQKYIPTFPQKPQPITIRQLLGHLGGIRHYRDDVESFNTKHYFNLSDALKIFEDDPLVAEPGTKYSYSTYGFVLLGVAIERASGLTYMEYMQKNVFSPAGMEHIQSDDVYTLIPNRSRGYSKRPDGSVVNAALHDTSGKIPGGGLVSRASDLVKFVLAIGDGKLLRPGSIQQMYTSQQTRAGELTHYGLGWGVGQFVGRTMVSHSGGQAGVSTLLRYLPEQKTAVALMFNMEQVDSGQLADSILQTILE